MRMSWSGLLTGCSPSWLDRDAAARLGTFDRAEHHRQALDVVAARRLRLRSVLHGCDEILDDAEMAADAVARVERRHLDRPLLLQDAVALVGPHRGADVVETVPGQRAALSDDAPGALPAGALTVCAPTAA